MHTDITVLDNLVAVNLSVTIWSARRKLTAEDFSGGVSTASLPPEELASLGSKRICNPADLRVFGTLKSRATTLLDRNGVRFLGGWALPETNVPAVQAELEAIATEFIKEKEAFLSRYDDAVRDWIQANPGWESIIANSLVSADYVRSRFGFTWQMFKVQTSESHSGQSVNTGLTEAVTSLGQTLFGEVAKSATEAWHKSFVGRQEVTRKALSPLKTIYNKLNGLSFIEPRVAPVADLLSTAFSAVGKKGHITGANLVMLQGLVSMLSDPEALLSHAQSILEGSSPDMILDSFKSGPIVYDVGQHVDEDPGEGSGNNQDVLPPKGKLLPAGPRLDSLGLW